MTIIDLSHTLDNDMPVYPGLEKPVFKEVYTVEKNGFKETSLNLLTHIGTHIDCPAHMLNSDITTDTVNLDSFYGQAFVADFSSKKQGEVIELNDVAKYENQLKRCDIILIYTDWDKYWGTDKYFEAFPYLSLEAVEYLLKFEIKAIGLDVISIDAIDAKVFQNHYKALGNNMMIIENLTRLEQLINKDFVFSALPLKIKSGDGSPVRAIAILN